MSARQPHESASRWWLLGLLGFALAVRLVFFTGFFGSDEVTYFRAASAIAHGSWPVSTYIGSLRYGMNLPNALFLHVFGSGELQAALWPLLCSVAEVALVYLFALRLWGLQAAVAATLLLALLPLHVHIAGMLLADPPVALGITLSMVLFHAAERKGRWVTHFLTGLATGFVFWVKEVVVIFGAVFGLYALVERRWDWRWIWVAVGTALMLAANCALLWAITGDPFYIFRITTKQVGRYAREFSVATSPWIYPRYLFADVRHTWLLGYLAIAGMWSWVRPSSDAARREPGMRYVTFWAIGLFLIFSLAPISFSPLTLIAKQNNYMLLFVSPLCLMGGWWLSLRRPLIRHIILGVWAAGAVLLSALAQQDVRVFTANSKATAIFAAEHPDAKVFALSNGYRAGIYSALLEGKDGSENIVGDLDSLLQKGRGGLQLAPNTRVYAVLDLETAGWSSGDPAQPELPSCWILVTTLKPQGIGWTVKLARMLRRTASAFEQSIPSAMIRILNHLVEPRPALLYEVPQRCV